MTKWLVRFLLAVGYVLAFIILTVLFTQVIDNFITENAIRAYAGFFGVYDAEGILDAYQNTAVCVSAVGGVLVILLCRWYVLRMKNQD